MKLIIDSGSSKASWALIKNKEHKIFETEGLNPHFVDKTFFDNELKKLKSEFNFDLINSIAFYGAGCGHQYFSEMIKNNLHNNFTNVKSIIVENDMIGAAVSLFYNQLGIACIIGTGSNSCIIDKNVIVQNLPAPGFVLGDEGAGTFLGKRLLRDFLYNRLPSEIMYFLLNDLALNEEEIYKNIYSSPRPNKYLASFAPIFDKFKNTDYAKEILIEGFDEFIKYHILPYKNYQNLPIGAVGSIAFIFQEAFITALKKYELALSVVYKQPIDGLIKKELNID